MAKPKKIEAKETPEPPVLVANPPKKNLPLLIGSLVLWVVWLCLLASLALVG